MGNKLMTPTEKEIEYFAIAGKESSGCKRHEKDIMLTYKSTNNPDEVIDLFMSDKKAEQLIKILQNTLKNNKK